ncbi:MAG: hypothetical protein IKB55_01425 [Clostridia bacterium]|nr:hypothetical protein [Clostridia bacterium]
MSYIKNEINKRHIPSVLKFVNGTAVTKENVAERRAEILDILQKHIYGNMPPAPDFVKGEVAYINDKSCAAGFGIQKIVNITFAINGKSFTFPVNLIFPKDVEKPPLCVLSYFGENAFREYIPVEQLINKGVALAAFCYNDVTSDNADYSDGMAALIGERKAECDTGKIAMWAYAESRVLDYILEHETVDTEKIAVTGHSRLGKTALVAGAFDERFTYVFSNSSGCAGAALARGNTGERTHYITQHADQWFCKKYATYGEKEEEMPFDQHFLLAAIAPRKVYVASSKDDFWADPTSEHLSCCAASEMYDAYGIPGFVCEDRAPEPGDKFHEGNIGYHMRPGFHFFSMKDWDMFLEYFLK